MLRDRDAAARCARRWWVVTHSVPLTSAALASRPPLGVWGERRGQLCTILHSRWIFPRDNEWIFSPTGPLLDLGSNSGQCLRA